MDVGIEADVGVNAGVEVAPPPPPTSGAGASVDADAAADSGIDSSQYGTPPTGPTNDDTFGDTSVAPPPAYEGPPAKEKRNNHFYLHVEGGYSYVNVAQFNNTNFLPSIDTFRGGGYTAGAGLGARIAFFSIGARATYSGFSTFDLASAGGELGLVLGLGPVDLYLRAGLAYGWMGNLQYANLNIDPQTRVTGLIADAALGLDLFFSDHFSLGVGVDAAWLNLARQRIQDATTIANINFTQDGDAAGLQGRGFARVGIHF